MGNFGTYCGTELVRYLSQIAYDQLSFKSESDATFNNFISGTLIPQAERFIDTYCNRSFGTPNIGTWSQDGSGKSFLVLPPKRTPCLGVVGGSVSNVALTVANIKIHDQFIEIDGGMFSSGKNNVTIEGSYGYVDGNNIPVVPSDIQMITAQLCANALNDMVRRRLLPDAYLKLLDSVGKSGASNFQMLFNAPHLFPQPMKDVCENYRITWTEMG